MKIVVDVGLRFDFVPFDEEVATLPAVQEEVEAEILEMLKELEGKDTMGITNVVTLTINITSDESTSYYQTNPAPTPVPPPE